MEVDTAIKMDPPELVRAALRRTARCLMDGQAGRRKRVEFRVRCWGETFQALGGIELGPFRIGVFWGHPESFPQFNSDINTDVTSALFPEGRCHGKKAQVPLEQGEGLQFADARKQGNSPKMLLQLKDLVL